MTISLRVDKELHDQMKLHDEVNWSAALRKSISEKIEALETIDYKRARAAAAHMDEICRRGVFSKGKPAVQIIREWRDKRR